MERLTLDTKILFCDISQCRETPGGSYCEDGYCDQRRCYERLREYERKGLAPEDITSGLELAEVYSAIRLLKQYEALGTIADLTALTKAREEGRVTVLPCKVGDTVYIIIHGIVEETKVRTFFVGHPSYNRGEPDPRYEMIRVENYDIPLKNFGKTVFLTRAEAEAALKGAGNGK